MTHNNLHLDVTPGEGVTAACTLPGGGASEAAVEAAKNRAGNTLPHGEPVPDSVLSTPQSSAPITSANRGGPPLGNSNASKHFLKSQRLDGSRLPKGYRAEENHVQKLGRLVRDAYKRTHGRDLDVYGQTLLLRILRAERSARWAARHLRRKGDDLPLSDQKMLLDTEVAAGEVIDKAMRQLKLDSADSALAVDPSKLLRDLAVNAPPTPANPPSLGRFSPQ